MIGTIGRMERPPWASFLIKASILAVTLAVAVDYVAGRYRLGIDWQVERCLPDTRAVLIDLRSDMPGRGELIAFQGRGLAPLFAEGTRMVKILVGLPGDRIEIDRERTLVNGTEVATGLHLADRLGYRSAAFERSFTVPDGQYFAVGRSDVSFDSRYFGLIDRDQVLGQARRLG